MASILTFFSQSREGSKYLFARKKEKEIKSGIEQGRQHSIKEMAKKLIQLGMSNKDIQKVTDLADSELDAL